MPRYHDKQTDKGVPVTIDRDRYTEGDVVVLIDGNVALGEKPGNVVFPVQIDASGRLKLVIGGGVTPNTEYSDGDASAGSKGRLVMGDDGANIQNISVDNNGYLQIEVVAGDYDGVQYQDGDAVASPFGTVVLGHDGSNVRSVMVDANGYLQVIEKKASVLNSVTDVTLAATSTTQVVGSFASRDRVTIHSGGSNLTFRIGDSNTGASYGIELRLGQTIEMETTEAIYAYNPAAIPGSVSVFWTER